MEFVITRAGIQEVEELTPLFDGYRVFYKQESDLEGAKKFLLERLSRDESVIFIAKHSTKNSLLGFVQLYPTFSSVRMRRKWILNDLFVAEEFRRKGAGLALMKTAESFAREGGAVCLILDTARNNAIAQNLYESMGYKKDTFIHYVLDLSCPKKPD